MKQHTPYLIGLAGWIGAVILSAIVYDALPPTWVESQGKFMQIGDPWAVLRTAIRLLVLVPLYFFMATGGLILFDTVTPDDWLACLADDQHGNMGIKIAVAIVLGAFTLGMAWVCTAV